MNKMLSIKTCSDVWLGLTASDIKNMQECCEYNLDTFMEKYYGLICENALDPYLYTITDESKLTLFLIQHSSAVEEISYE